LAAPARMNSNARRVRPTMVTIVMGMAWSFVCYQMF
jgi:hypothetical protein